MTAPTPETLWVQSDVAPDGTSYMVGFHYGEDRAWSLTRDQAIRHAVAVFAEAERAEHDAATVELLHTKLGMPLETAVAFLVRDIRPDRPPTDQPGPFTVAAGVSRDGGLHGYLRLLLDGEVFGQWRIGDAHHHAGAVLQAVAAVDSDATLYRTLIGVIDLDESRARAVVADIGNHRRQL